MMLQSAHFPVALQGTDHAWPKGHVSLAIGNGTISHGMHVLTA